MCECQKVVFTDVIVRRTTWSILDLTTECVCCSRRLSPAPTHVDKTPSPWCRHDLWRTGVETGVEMWMSCSESSHSIKTSYKVRRRSRDEAEWRRARLYISTEQRDWVQPLRRVTSVTWRLVTTCQTLAIEEVLHQTQLSCQTGQRSWDGDPVVTCTRHLEGLKITLALVQARPLADRGGDWGRDVDELQRIISFYCSRQLRPM